MVSVPVSVLVSLVGSGAGVKASPMRRMTSFGGTGLSRSAAAG
ncbi:hypothetical protein ACFC4G_13585 [Streptomyces sp. NPDC056002]